MTEAGSERAPGNNWRPVPDPTELTNSAVTQAKDDLRRELSGDRELLSERITRVDAFVRDVDVRLKADIADSVNALEAILVQRITGLEQIMKMLDGVLKNAPGERDDLRERLQNDIKVAVDNLQHLHEERFNAIQQQFNERDTRGDQEKKASKEALDAALLAQKESVAQQNDANTTAAAKTELNFTKQNDQTAVLISTLEKSLSDRLTELKERIDRGEGSTSGAADTRIDQRASIGTVIAAVATLVAVISFILLILRK
jgi:hypothetical protein